MVMEGDSLSESIKKDKQIAQLKKSVFHYRAELDKANKKISAIADELKRIAHEIDNCNSCVINI